MHSKSVPRASFLGLLNGVEVVKPPGQPEEDDVLCLVVDPLAASNDPAIRDSVYHARRGWRTYLYQSGAVAYAEQRLWVPASGISEMTIDTGYISEAILDVIPARSDGETT